jgi:hypothetical protein
MSTTFLPPPGSISPAADLGALLSGEAALDDQPALLFRSDGQALLYSAALNALNAEPGAGKTWLALVASLALSRAGEHALYLDAESTAPAMAERLRALGAEPSDLGQLHYHVVGGPLRDAEQAWLRRQVDDLAVRLVVVDSLGEVLAACGVDTNSDAETARALASIFRPLARLGACVLLLDHVTKNLEDRGRWAIGSQRKLAAIDGAAYSLGVVQPWARGASGSARLVLAKDRRGWVGPIDKTAADVRFDAWPDGGLRVSLTPPKADDTPMPGTVAHVVGALESAGGRWTSFSEAVAYLEPLKESGARAALARATKAGAVIEERGVGNLKMYRLPKVFAGTPVGEDDDPKF